MGKFTVWAFTFAVLTAGYAFVSNVGAGEPPKMVGAVTIGLAIIAVFCVAMSVLQKWNDV